MTSIIYVGMDVHTTNYTLCCYSMEDDRFFAEVQVEPDAKNILKYLARIEKQQSRDCRIVCGYEAGCLGYSLYHPYSPVYIPTEVDDAVKEYIRMRDDANSALARVKQQIIAFCIRHGKIHDGKSYWTNKHLEWISSLDLGNKILSEVLQEYLIRYYQQREQVDMYDMRINELAQAEPYRQKVEKLGCFRGIAAHTALSFCVEVGDFRRFATAQQFASYLGLVPGECSSGDKQQYTGITKAGNSHLRKLLVETAQVFGRSATKSGKSVALKERQAKCDSLTVAYADKANARLKKKYFKVTPHKYKIYFSRQ